MADVPALYYAQNVGVEVLAGKDPVAYAALNIGVEPQTGTDPAAYGALNIGDWAVGNVDNTLGPEFAFAPILDSLVPDFGRVGQQVIAYGVGFGDEKTFVRWGNIGIAGGVTGGDAKAGPGTIDSTVAPWTLETWFRSQQQGPYDTAAALETGELAQLLTAGSSVEYSLELASGKVKIIGPSSESVESSLAYDDGKWHHARVVLNAANKLHLLVDGIPLGSVASSSVAVAKVELAQSYRGDQRATRFMKSDLGTHIFNTDWTPSVDAATVALWQMDDGSGTTLTDTSGNGHDLTISGVDYIWTAWDFDVQVTLSAVAQDLDADNVRSNELRWTVAAGAVSGPALVKHTAKHVDQSASKTFTVLPTVPLRGVGFEIRVYDKDNYNTLLEIFENAREVSFSLELNGPGAGSFSLNLNDAKATSANLAHGNLIRIYLDAVERFAFRIEGTKENLAASGDASAQSVSVSGRGLLAALDDAITYPPNWPSSDPLMHEFVGASAGEIMKTLVDAAVARGALNGVTVDFDDSDDSDGDVWNMTYILDYYPGQTLTQVAQQLVGLGADIRMTSNQVLQFYNALGLDRTLGDAPTVFAQGDNLILHSRDGTSNAVKNTMLMLRGDILMEQSTPSDFTRREAFIDTRQTEDLSTAQELAVRTLETMSEVNDSFDANVISVQDHSEAFVDWDLGDTVYVETESAGRVQYRIHSVTVKQTDDGRPEFSCTLGNMRFEYLVRLKRMIDMYTGGSLAGGSGGGMVGTATPNLIGIYLDTPIDAKYVMLEAHAGLTQERVLTAGTGITLTDGGAGAAVTLAHDTGDIGDVHPNYLEAAEVVALIEAEDPLDLAGVLNLAKYIDFDSIADPGAPAASVVRLFANNKHLIGLDENDLWHDLSMGGKSAPVSVHEEPTISDEGGLNIKWGAGEIYDPSITGASQMVTIPAQTVNQTLTASDINWVYYDQSDNAQLKVTATESDIGWGVGDIPIAHIITTHNDILEIHQYPVSHEVVHSIMHGLSHAIEKAVFSGMIVGEHPAANAFDVDQSAGAFVESGFRVHDVAKIESTVTNIIRWFHDAGDVWSSDTSSQIDAANWDDDDDGLVPKANNNAKYYRSVFACDGANIHWVYPQVEYATINQALTAPNPTLPPLLEHLPLTTALVMKGNDAALPTAGDDQWIDVRPLIGAVGTGGTITSHLNLADIGTDDHHVKFTGGEAIAAVEGEATLDLTGEVTIASGKSLTLKTDGATGGLKLGAAGDVILYRGAANKLYLGTGDSFRIVSGNLELGADVSLARGAANRLDLASGDKLRLVSGNVELVTGKVLEIFNAFGDANPLAKLSSDSLEFGAGGASALDTHIKRSAAGTVTFERSADGAFWEARVTGDTEPRMRLGTTQGIEMGPGGVTVPDLKIQTYVMNTVRTMRATGGFTAQPAASSGDWYTNVIGDLALRLIMITGAAKEANPRARYAHDRVEFGPGGAAALDVALLRGAANRLDLATGDSFRIVSGELQIGADVALLRGAADRLDLKSGDNFKIVSGYQEFTEIASPANPVANDLRLFAKDVGGVTSLVTRDSAGLETVLGEGTKAFAFFMG